MKKFKVKGEQNYNTLQGPYPPHPQVFVFENNVGLNRVKGIMSCTFKYLKIYAVNSNNMPVSTICVIALVKHSIFFIDLFYNQEAMAMDRRF